MQATIKLTEPEIKAIICNWMLKEYGVSVNATNDIKIKDYTEEWLGDPAIAPVRCATRYGAEVQVNNLRIKK